jgi:hypothetical protein
MSYLLFFIPCLAELSGPIWLGINLFLDPYRSKLSSALQIFLKFIIFGGGGTYVSSPSKLPMCYNTMLILDGAF